MNRRAAAMLAIPIGTMLSTAAAAQAVAVQPDTRRMLIGTAATAVVKEVLLGPGVRVQESCSSRSTAGRSRPSSRRAGPC